MEAREPILEASLPAQNDCLGHHQRCPLCARDNDCRVAKGLLYKGPCWCHQIIVPNHILTRLAEDTIDSACLCRTCLETIAEISRSLDGTEVILAEVRTAIVTNRIDQNAEAVADFYLDDLGNTVFTAAYHLRRGNCCQNGCRHCPY